MAGDSEHKPYICGEADHDVFPLDGSEDYLILACDGFWDTMTPDEAVAVVSDHLEENTGDTTMVAHKLVASARDAGSSDNITVIVVFLRDPRSPLAAGARKEGAVQGEAGREEEEEDDAVGAERGDGGKGRGGWPVQQCSAPADLGYEDRTDSFTDRTSLDLMGPSLEGRVSLVSRRPRPDFCPDLFGAFHVHRGEERPPRRRSRLALREPGDSGFTDPPWPRAEPPWPLGPALWGRAARQSRVLGPGSRRRVRRRPGASSRQLGLLPAGLLLPLTQQRADRRPGVAAPHRAHDTTF